MAKIRVCGTSANLGPGFDTIGAALSIYNEFVIEEIDEGFDFQGYKTENHEDNLIYQAIKYYFDLIGYKMKGLRVIDYSNVPLARGLGSSSTCVVAGIAGAMLIAEKKIDRELLLNLATKMEGHPDNVAPAIYGGIVTSILLEDKVICNIINKDTNLKFYAIVPDFELKTSHARNVLPKELEYKDIIFNISRASFLVAELVNNSYDNLKESMEDKLHQNYRKSLIMGYDEVFEMAYTLGAKGVYLSGAGPTIMAISTENIGEKLSNNISKISGGWRVIPLSLDLEGIKYE